MGFVGSRTSVFLGLTLLVILFGACGGEVEPSLDARANSINKSLICPVCPGETIDQAQVELARQMRTIVREKLADGWTRDQTLQFFVDRYGDGVLAAPPKSGFNLVVWVVPLAAVIAAVGTVMLVIRAMRRSSVTAREDGRKDGPPAEAGLEPYLSLVDQELGFAQAGPVGKGPEEAPGGGAEDISPVNEDV